MSKQADPDQITGAIDAVVSGAMWLGAGVARPTLSSTTTEALPGLTPREAMIADLVSRGLTNPMIAERLSLSTKTVANYVSTLMLKLGAATAPRRLNSSGRRSDTDMRDAAADIRCPIRYLAREVFAASRAD